MNETSSIEGTLLMLDGLTPHVVVPVQAIQDGKVMATVLSGCSTHAGKYCIDNLKPGPYQLRCQVLDGYVYYRAEGEAQWVTIDGSEEAGDIIQVGSGEALSNINFRFASIKKGTWKNLTYMDGLVENYVTFIYRDPDGIMWFATLGGISRYDGKEFNSFTERDGLASNTAYTIHRDPDGVMWFATFGGVSIYNGEEFLNLTTSDGLADNRVRDIYQDPDGLMWFATFSGVSRYDGERFANLTTKDGLVDDQVYKIYQDSDGVMWFATFSGVSRYNGGEFRNFTEKDGLGNSWVYDIYQDPGGVMWFATFGGGVSRYDGKKFANITREDGLVNDHVYSIHRDEDGLMWFATWGTGISRYDGKSFLNFAKEDGLVDNRVLAIYRDTAGVLWFGTEGGISRYDTETFVSFTMKDGLPHDDISSIHQTDDGVMWFGTSAGGVSLYNGKSFSNINTRDGLVDDRVMAIHCAPDGALWFGTYGGGISRYDGKSFLNFTVRDGLLENIAVYSICSEPDGVMWFATHEGVSRYDGNRFTNFTREDGLADNLVLDVHRAQDGTLLFASPPAVSCYDGESFCYLTTEDGLANEIVRVIHGGPNGMIWFGTHSGVSRYDGKEFVNFTTEAGFVSAIVKSIYVAPEGTLWVGTNGGLACYDGTAWTSLDTRDGLTDNVIQAIHRDAEGDLWFGTEQGITRYRPGNVSPKVHIVSVTTDRTYRLRTQDTRLRTERSVIPAFIIGTRITIEYSSIDLVTAPEKRQYRCRVYETGDLRHETSDRRQETPRRGDLDSTVSSLKSDVSYNPPTKETTFDWIPERPGTYIFEVQAIDRDLNYSEPAILSLTIQPDPKLLSMQAELNHLRREVGQKYHFGNIIGRSDGIMQVRALMESAIDSGLTVLITGETGTGKELVAKAVHHNSQRKARPLLALNCGAIPKELLTSELFGHCRGAFTGAYEDKMGLFEAASGGTILLDEISEMPQDSQVHLLRVLEEHKVQRLGEHVSRDVDVRVIAMTNRDLMKEVLEGRFREDLYYRLSVFPIPLPALRERPEDVPILAEHFLQEIDKQLDGFAPDVFEMLQSYSWPGNVRELRNAIHRAAALAEGKIQTYHFPPEITRGESLIQDIASERMGLSASVETLQRRLIEDALRECNGNHTYAARMLKMHRSNFVRLMKRLGVEYLDVPN